MKKILLTTAAVATIAAANANFYVGVNVAGQALNTKLSGGQVKTPTVTRVAGTAAAALTATEVTTDSNFGLDINGNKWHHNYRFGAQAGYAMAMEGGFWGALDINAHFGGANKEATSATERTTATTDGDGSVVLNATAAGTPAVGLAAATTKAATLSNKFNAGIGVKLGYKAGNAIPYVYVGGDYGQFKIYDNTPATADSKTKNKFGFAAGVGVIGHINEMVSVEVAYRYSDHGNFKYTYTGNVNGNVIERINSATGTDTITATALKHYFSTANNTAIGEVKHKLRSHTATIGFNVHFG